MKIPLHFHLVVLLLGGILFFYVLDVASLILIPLVFAALMSLFLLPLCRKLEQWNFSRGLAIASSLLVVVLGIVVIISLIYSNLISFQTDLPQMQSRSKDLVVLLQNTIAKQFQISEEQQLLWLKQNLDGLINAAGKQLNGVINSLSIYFSQLFIIPIYVFFMLYYRNIFKNFIHKIIDDQHIEKATVIENQIQTVVQKYIVGLFSVVSIIAMLNITGLVVIGVKHALFFGILAGFLTIIPYIGIFIGASLPILYALVMYDSLYIPLAVLVWFVIVQFLEGNFITPNIVGSQVSINPLVAMLALLVGGTVWGIAGMILFVPLVAICKVVLDNIPTLSPYGYLLGEGDKPAPSPEQVSFWRLWLAKLRKK